MYQLRSAVSTRVVSASTRWVSVALWMCKCFHETVFVALWMWVIFDSVKSFLLHFTAGYHHRTFSDINKRRKLGVVTIGKYRPGWGLFT